MAQVVHPDTSKGQRQGTQYAEGQCTVVRRSGSCILHLSPPADVQPLETLDLGPAILHIRCLQVTAD